MKELYVYVVVDVVAETLVSTFFAPNDNLALRIYSDSFKEVPESVKSDYCLRRMSDKVLSYPEVISDIKDSVLIVEGISK